MGARRAGGGAIGRARGMIVAAAPLALAAWGCASAKGAPASPAAIGEVAPDAAASDAEPSASSTAIDADGGASPVGGGGIARVTAGPLSLAIVDARTAQLFYVVDQVSRWSPACHPQYARWAAKAWPPLDDEDRTLLAKHAELRRARGWGSGFEVAFGGDADLDAAAEAAIRDRLLTDAEAHAERDVLARFAARVDPMLDARRGDLTALAASIARAAPSVAAVAEPLARLLDVKGPIVLPVLLVPDPDAKESRAAYAARRIVVEAAAGSDATPPFLHALFHAVLLRRRESFAVAAANCKQPIDEQTLEQAAAYALAPGMVHAADDDGDPLARMVDAQRAEKRTLREPIVRSARLALAVREELRRALDEGKSLRSFLHSACEAWKRVAREERPTRRPPSVHKLPRRGAPKRP